MTATAGDTDPDIGAAVLLRAVNVGVSRSGRSIKMADLREAVSDLGLADVTTYLQSGNLVCAVTPDRLASLGGEVVGAVNQALGVDTRALVRTHQELAEILAQCPFPLEDGKRVHVVFLEREPDPDAVAGLDPDRSPPDRFVVDGRQIYVDYPDGSARSKVSLAWFESQLDIVGTARNVNTVRALLERTERQPS